MAYIGRGINSGDAVSDHLTGSGATVYTLTYDTTTDGVVLSLDGVVQRNGTDFTILGTQLTFTSAVASPIAIQVIYTGLTLAIGTPGTGTVGNAQMADDAIGIAELSSTGTASSSTYLRGDNSWATIPATADEITKSSSDPTISTNPAGGVGTLYLNTTSGEMFSLTDATAGANAWTNIGEGTGNVIPYLTATGGTITADGDYKIHSFTSSSNFVVGTGGDVEYLVLAGGGGGSQSYAGAGGAGGYLTATGFAVAASTTFAITVGAGGAGGAPGVSGSNSIFSTITSVGGGRGGYSLGQAGVAGGSGGGGGWNGGAGGAATAGQGNAGGAGISNMYGGGGGGGAGSAGSSNSGSAGGAGGNGLSSSITGSAIYRGGGGGGGGSGSEGAGVHGGGTGEGSNAIANYGGGGGGAWNGSALAGGSGVVIIRYRFQN